METVLDLLEEVVQSAPAAVQKEVRAILGEQPKHLLDAMDPAWTRKDCPQGNISGHPKKERYNDGALHISVRLGPLSLKRSNFSTPRG